MTILVVVLALLVVIPTRRLYLAGWSTGLLFGYFLFVFALGLLVAELRGPARYLVPLLVIAYLGPFVAARAGLERMAGRGRRGSGPGSDGAGQQVRAERPDVRLLKRVGESGPDGSGQPRTDEIPTGRPGGDGVDEEATAAPRTS